MEPISQFSALKSPISDHHQQIRPNTLTMNHKYFKIRSFKISCIKGFLYFCSPCKKGNGVHLTPNGSVVQLVRIHACHAWGRGFESRPDRLNCKKALNR